MFHIRSRHIFQFGGACIGFLGDLNWARGLGIGTEWQKQ